MSVIGLNAPIVYPLTAPLGSTPGGSKNYSALAKAYFARLASQPSPVWKSRYDALLTALNSAGILAKLDALTIFGAPDEATGKTDLINSTLTWTNGGSLTFVAGHGYFGDNSHTIDSNFNPSTAGGKFAKNSATIGAWSLGYPGDSGGSLIGYGPTTARVDPRYSATQSALAVNDSGAIAGTSPVPSAAGHWTAVRTGASAAVLYYNGSQLATESNSSVSLANAVMKMFNVVGWAQVGAAYWGQQLSGTDVANLHTALNTFFHSIFGGPRYNHGLNNLCLGAALDTGGNPARPYSPYNTGALPHGQFMSVQGSWDISIVSVSPVDGIPGLTFHVTGTIAGDGSQAMNWLIGRSTDGGDPDYWRKTYPGDVTFSVYSKLIAGDPSHITFKHDIDQYQGSSPVYISTFSTPAYVPTATMQRFTGTASLTAPATTSIHGLGIFINDWQNFPGASMDCTLFIGGWQFEDGDVENPLIWTGGSQIGFVP